MISGLFVAVNWDLTKFTILFAYLRKRTTWSSKSEHKSSLTLTFTSISRDREATSSILLTREESVDSWRKSLKLWQNNRQLTPTTLHGITLNPYTTFYAGFVQWHLFGYWTKCQTIKEFCTSWSHFAMNYKINGYFWVWHIAIFVIGCFTACGHICDVLLHQQCIWYPSGIAIDIVYILLYFLAFKLRMILEGLTCQIQKW